MITDSESKSSESGGECRPNIHCARYSQEASQTSIAQMPKKRTDLLFLLLTPFIVGGKGLKLFLLLLLLFSLTRRHWVTREVGRNATNHCVKTRMRFEGSMELWSERETVGESWPSSTRRSRSPSHPAVSLARSDSSRASWPMLATEPMGADDGMNLPCLARKRDDEMASQSRQAPEAHVTTAVRHMRGALKFHSPFLGVNGGQTWVSNLHRVRYVQRG